MIVYRFEKDGVGPYSANWTEPLNWYKYHGDNFDKLPSISIDVREYGSFTRDYLCACESLDKLCSWFGEFVDNLLEAGFKCVVYQTADVLLTKSGAQVAFRKETALRIGEI